ncbi:hypothetical protein [Nocardioides cynanchi]|uniref:hypothetical protein n=1 Tax=Nocardioides cynanchi TaxID=2558918 RepID=UPI0012483506|nr:hypothetical protein [Nocardioides cynanchi]
MGALALFLVLGTGTAYAASSMWTGANVVDGSLTGADVQDGSLSGTDIQNGSITSSDLASGTVSGGSGSATVLQWDDQGPFDFAASPNSQETLATKTFTTATDGFVDFRFAGQIAGDANVCNSQSGYFAVADAIIDGSRKAGLEVDIEDDGAGPATGYQERVSSTYLTAGTHTISLTSHVYDCTAPQGNFHLTGLHVLATNPS